VIGVVVIDRKARLEVAERAARAAGAELLRQRGRASVREKGRFDLVTDADVAAQRVIQEELAAAYPDDAFLGEECNTQSAAYAPGQAVWVVDPLDGTTNYVHDNPTFAVSVGLVIDGRAEAGVIYDPCRDEVFRAARGLGTFLNGKPLHCSPIDSLEHALISVGFPANWQGQEAVLAAWRWFGYQTQGMRRTGSSALNLAYVAAGRFDGFFAFQICPWDVAAGIVMVEEAGGRISRRDGGQYDVFSSELIVASNGSLHAELFRGLPPLD